MGERRAVTKEMARRYRKAPKKAKGLVLDELCTLTGWGRDHARKALRLAGRPEVSPARRARSRAPTYGEDLMGPLTTVWAVLNGPCGKRLHPVMAETLEALERFGEIELGEGQREQLLGMSASTIDRRLGPERKRLQVKGRSGTKPGSLLKHQIPIRTFSDWDEHRPGFFEADLVAHDGGNSRGDYCQTLDLTDVATGWTETAAVKNKAQVWVFEQLKAIRARLPFALLGLDSDNGSEFINDELLRYCTAEHIRFTRGRAYRKNDSCYIEEKNWTVVRQHVGYARYDTPAELAVLQELYGYLRLYVNFFLPHMKLREKTREGARVRKRYDIPATPYRRLLAFEEVLSEEAKAALTACYLELNPMQLKRDIGRCQDELIRLTRLKEQRRQTEARAAAASGARRRKAPATPLDAPATTQGASVGSALRKRPPSSPAEARSGGGEAYGYPQKATAQALTRAKPTRGSNPTRGQERR